MLIGEGLYQWLEVNDGPLKSLECKHRSSGVLIRSPVKRRFRDQGIGVMQGVSQAPQQLLEVLLRTGVGWLMLPCDLILPLILLCDMLLQFAKRQALCIGSFIYHAFDAPCVFDLLQCIACPEPATLCHRIDCGAHGSL